MGIKGKHYTSKGNYWGTIEYRLIKTTDCYQYAGEYEVWYAGSKRSTNMIIKCSGSVEQPGIFTDKLRFDGVTAQCDQDADATLYILGTHGASKYECLHREGTTIKGKHYTSKGNYWGNIEYRLIKTTDCYQYAGEYEVWYAGSKRGTNMIIKCSGSVEQPGIFTDKLRF